MSHFQITFRDMLPSDALRAVAEKKFARVHGWFGRAASCIIVIGKRVDGPASAFTARVLVQTGRAGRQVSAAASSDDATAAVHDAFQRATAQLDAAPWPVAHP